MTKKEKGLEFVEVEVCTNPMESEIFTAALREAEIPHRTQWTEDGKLILMVASGWQEQAKQTLDRASEVFFNQARKEYQSVALDGNETQTQNKKIVSNDIRDAAAVPGNDVYDDASEWGRPMFSADSIPSPEETRIRAVWPAWALAAIPGLGLGHLYAGKMQMFFYLIFCSMLGGLFFRYTGSAWSFGLTGFSWAMDLGFAAYHVKQHNRSAARAKKRLERAEQEFYDSLPDGGANGQQ